MRYLFLIPFLIVFNSFAQSNQIPYNGEPNIEMKRSGNTYTWVPASSGPGAGVTFQSSAGISTVDPKMNYQTQIPYQNKAGAAAKVNITASIDPKKVAAKAASAISAAAGALASSPYVTVAAIGCSVFCDALINWGLDKIKPNGDGTFSAVVPDPSVQSSTSDGKEYCTASHGSSICGAELGWFSSVSAAQSALLQSYKKILHPSLQSTLRFEGEYVAWDYPYFGQTATAYGAYNGTQYRISSCPSGSPIVNGVCNGNAPTIEQPLETYIESNYKGKGWNSHWASMTAQIIKDGGNVFTDGTSADITGPVTIPVSGSESKNGVTLISGTTNIAPPGYTGATDPGTQTTTTTTTARNTFNPAPLSSGSSSSAPSGPSMTTTTEKLTTTSITNNITNTTNIVNQSTEKSEDPPEEEVKDTPLGPIPDLYKQKYPNGLKGVVTQKIAVLKTTPLFSLPMQLMGNLPDTGNCPSWQLDLNLATWANFGTHNIGADCSVWQFASVVVLISAFILARALVFGG